MLKLDPDLRCHNCRCHIGQGTHYRIDVFEEDITLTAGRPPRFVIRHRLCADCAAGVASLFGLLRVTRALREAARSIVSRRVAPGVHRAG